MRRTTPLTHPHEACQARFGGTTSKGPFSRRTPDATPGVPCDPTTSVVTQRPLRVGSGRVLDSRDELIQRARGPALQAVRERVRGAV